MRTPSSRTIQRDAVRSGSTRRPRRTITGLACLILAAAICVLPHRAHPVGFPTQGGDWESWKYTVEKQCPAPTLVWANLQAGLSEYKFTVTCQVVEKGGSWKEGTVNVTIQALWKSDEKRAWEKVLVSGAWTGHVDTQWSCPGDPFIGVGPCTRESLNTNLHPAVANTNAPFAANATTAAKAAQADAAGDAAKKAQLESAASLAKGTVPFVKIESPEQGKVYTGGVVIKVQPQNVPSGQWFAQCCEIELARSSATGPTPAGPWATPLVYGDRNDVMTPFGWGIAQGALEAGWWRVRVRGCCITNADTGVGTAWPWSPWREFRVVASLASKSAIGGGSTPSGPFPPSPSGPKPDGVAVRRDEGPRLAVRAIAPESGSPTAGQPLRLAITVANDGSAPSQGPIWIGCSASAGGTCSFPTTASSLRTPLGPGQTQVLVFDAPSLGPGRYEIKAGLDRGLGVGAARIEVTVPASGRGTPAPRRTP